MKALIGDFDGYALIIVLWTLVILSIIFVNLVDETQLNSFLVRNNLDNIKLYNLSISGIIIGIDKLKEDDTEYDTLKDEWKKRVETKVDNLKYQVEVEDIGSKLNINYASNSILSKFDWWDEEVNQKIEEKFGVNALIPEISLIQDILGENYSKATEVLTTYGYFNLNSDDLNKLRALLERLKLNNTEINLIYQYLNKERKEGRRIKKPTQLESLYLKGLSEKSLESIKPYITTNAALNINLIPEDILELILKKLNLNLKYKEKIIKLRQSEGIKKLSEISTSEKKLLNYFSVSSKFFLIKSSVLSQDGRVLKEISCVVERSKGEDDKWRVRILKWDEE